MVRGKPIPMSDRQMIISFYQRGEKVAKIARKLHLPWNSVKNLVRKWEANGFLYDPPRKGRPRKTTPRQDRKIVTTALQNRRLCVRDLNITVFSGLDKKVSDDTVRRRLHEAKLYGKQAKKKPLLMRRHLLARKKWCQEKQHWTANQWSKVLWSDESKFCLFGRNGFRPVWRRPGEALKPECLQATVKHGGGKFCTAFPQLYVLYLNFPLLFLLQGQ